METDSRSGRDTEEISSWSWSSICSEKKEMSLNRAQLSFLEIVIKRRKDTVCNMDTIMDMLNTLDDRDQKFTLPDTVLAFQRHVIHTCFAPQYKDFFDRAIKDIESNDQSAQLLHTFNDENHTRDSDEKHNPLIHLMADVDKPHLGHSIERESTVCTINRRHKYLFDILQKKNVLKTCINWLILSEMFNRVEDVDGCFWRPEDVEAAYNEYFGLIEKGRE